MEQVQVEITGLISTSRYGNMSPGTILRTDAAFAKHLVEEAGAAKYVQVKSVPAVDETPVAETETPPAVDETPVAETETPVVVVKKTAKK